MMKVIKLGPQGQEIQLPTPRFRSAPAWPVSVERAIEEHQVLDGSYRYAFKEKERRTWSLEWDLLTADQVYDFDFLAGLKQTLRYRNEWQEKRWYDVIITSYEKRPILDIPNKMLWGISLTLKEVV